MCTCVHVYSDSPASCAGVRVCCSPASHGPGSLRTWCAAHPSTSTPRQSWATSPEETTDTHTHTHTHTHSTVIFRVQIWGAVGGGRGHRCESPGVSLESAKRSRTPSPLPHTPDSEGKNCQSRLAPVQSIQEAAQQERARQYEPHMRTHIHTPTHLSTHARTHTHSHTRVRTRSHKHAHTHSREGIHTSRQRQTLLRLLSPTVSVIKGVLHQSGVRWNARKHSDVCTASSLSTTRKQQTDLFKAHYRRWHHLPEPAMKARLVPSARPWESIAEEGVSRVSFAQGAPRHTLDVHTVKYFCVQWDSCASCPHTVQGPVSWKHLNSVKQNLR